MYWLVQIIMNLRIIQVLWLFLQPQWKNESNVLLGYYIFIIIRKILVLYLNLFNLFNGFQCVIIQLLETQVVQKDEGFNQKSR